MIEIKILFSILAAVASIAAFSFYIKDLYHKKVTPHLYTWLIWSITVGTAALGVWVGGGLWGALGLTVMWLITVSIAIYSIWNGTKNITKSDKVVLFFALLAIGVWWQLDNPLLAVLMVTGINTLGYIPTFRKTFVDPYSETIIFWIIGTSSNLFGIAALSEYNLLTLTFLTSMTLANLGLISIILLRRSVMKVSS